MRVSGWPGLIPAVPVVGYTPSGSATGIASIPVRVLPRRNLTLMIVAVALIAACGKTPPITQPTIVTVTETVEVKVPIPVKAEPPPELLAPFKIPLPVFVAPSDADTSSALTVEGERFLRGLIEELLGRLEAWKKWAEAK